VIISTGEFGANTRSSISVSTVRFMGSLHLDDDVSKALFLTYGDAGVTAYLWSFRRASTETNRLLVKRSQNRAETGTICFAGITHQSKPHGKKQKPRLAVSIKRIPRRALVCYMQPYEQHKQRPLTHLERASNGARVLGSRASEASQCMVARVVSLHLRELQNGSSGRVRRWEGARIRSLTPRKSSFLHDVLLCTTKCE
jgi:hypothetical protein